jgi:pimeloyl-ACP methyl ester carboxylesterase
MIDKGMFVDINGVDQWLTIRGGDRRNPALLILSGPGAALSPLAMFYAPWEARFTLVQWDQPGAGATHGKNGEAGTGPLSIERIARDGIAVAEFVCEYLDTRKIAVLGFSGGTIVGLHMVSRRPDLFSAYVGSGQIVNWARQDALGYELLLQRARGTGDATAVAELESIGPPPYPDTATDAIKSKYAGAMTAEEQGEMGKLIAVMQSIRPDASYLARGVKLEDPRARSLVVYDRLRNDIVAFDAWRLGLEFQVPMFFFQGEDDLFTVTSEVRRYEAEITAPRKAFVPIEGAGHSTFVLRDRLLALLETHLTKL